MTREEAIAVARQCAKEFPESYTNLPPGAEFEPHPWVVHAILRASQPKMPIPPPLTDAEHVFALCASFGFGFVMQTAAEQWAARDPVGALTVGPPVGVTEDEHKPDVRDLVLDMRDTFLTMVTAYNAVGAYQSAQDAQTMALTLHKYEDAHPLTELAWPMALSKDDYGKGLKTTDGKVRYGEDL